MIHTKKTRTPYQDYLDTLKTAIYSMAEGNKKIADEFYEDELKAIEEINSDLPSVLSQPNHPERLFRTAEYITEFVMRNALTIKSYGKHGKADITPCYALEYYGFDDESLFNSDTPYFRLEGGDYDKKINKLWAFLRTHLPTEPDSTGYYTIIDFEAITHSVKSMVDEYYKRNPNLLKKVKADKGLQKEFGQLLGSITREITQRKTSSHNYNI